MLEPHKNASYISKVFSSAEALSIMFFVVRSIHSKAEDAHKETLGYGQDLANIFTAFSVAQEYAKKKRLSLVLSDKMITSYASFSAYFPDGMVAVFEFPYDSGEYGTSRENVNFKLYPSKEEALLGGTHEILLSRSVDELMSVANKDSIAKDMKDAGIKDDMLYTSIITTGILRQLKKLNSSRVRNKFF